MIEVRVERMGIKDRGGECVRVFSDPPPGDWSSLERCLNPPL